MNDSSDMWYECASFCAPVRKGSTVQVQSQPTVGQTSVYANWVPLLQRTLGNRKDRTVGQLYTADTDGFLVGVLSGVNNGARGELKLRVGPSGSNSLNDSNNLGMASVHFYNEGGDNWLRYNSTTVPISKGCVYQAELSTGAGQLDCVLYWVSLT